VGIQPYLTTKPLVWALKSLAPEIQLCAGTPREISTLLVRGELDVALIPLVTVLRNPDLCILPGISVSTSGKAHTSLLFSRVAPADIKTILVDQSSINSVALLRVLFRIRLSMQPVEVLSSNPITSDYSFDQEDYDAYLVIGDAALKIAHSFAKVIDLGEQWEEWVRQPMVHAVWAVRGNLLGPPLHTLFLEAKKAGLKVLEEIARLGAKNLGMDVKKCLEILQGMNYDLGLLQIKGVGRFYYYLEALRICRPQTRLRFYHGDHVKIHSLDQGRMESQGDEPTQDIE
jgi:predicted solute-binding protein